MAGTRCQTPVVVPAFTAPCECIVCEQRNYDREAHWAIGLRDATLAILTQCLTADQVPGCGGLNGGFYIGRPELPIVGDCACEGLGVGFLGWDSLDVDEDGNCSVRAPARYEVLVGICGYTLDGDDGTPLPAGDDTGEDLNTRHGVTFRAMRIGSLLRASLRRAWTCSDAFTNCKSVTVESVEIDVSGRCLNVIATVIVSP